MPALDALHLKMIYSDDVRVNSRLRDYTDTYLKSLKGAPETLKAHALYEKETGEAQPITSPNTWATEYDTPEFMLNMSRWLDAAQTFYIDPRMHALVTAASESMPQEEVLPRDLPADFGFMLIPGGMAVIDVRGKALKYNAVQWATFGSRVHVAWLTDKNDMQDSTNLSIRARNEKMWMEMPRLSWNGFVDLRFGKPLPLMAGPDFLVPPGRELKVLTNKNSDGSTSMAWAFDKGYSPEELAEKMSVSVRTDPAARWLLAAWRLMQQTVTSVTEEHAPRQMRRQLERKNIDTKVTVIALRHAPSRGDGESDVEWSHRWLVKGHWRNQPCKEDGEWTHRLIWIHPHIRGPQDKPLIIRDHVYSLIR